MRGGEKRLWFVRAPLIAGLLVATSDATADDDVHVVGDKPTPTTGSQQVLGDKALQRFEYDDPHAVLAQVPGVYTRGEDGFGLRPNIGIRGAASDRSKKVTLMEDGVLLAPAPYSAPAAYYFPLITRMQNVRIVKGPGAIAYGPNTVGGALDLITRDIPEARRGTLDLAAGQFGYAKVHGTFGASDDNAGFLLEGVHLGSTGFKELGDADTGFDRNEIMAKGRWVVDPRAETRNEFLVKLGYSDEASNETYLGLTDADFRASPYRRYPASALDRMVWHRTQIALTHKVTFSPDLSIETTAYRNDFDRTWRKFNNFRGIGVNEVLADPKSPSAEPFYRVLTGQNDSSSPAETILVGPNHRTFVSEGVQMLTSLKTKTGPIEHRLEYGTRIHHDSVERVHTEDGYFMRGGVLVQDGGRTVTTTNDRAWTIALAMHVRDAMLWGPLTVIPGVRVELIHSRAEDRLQVLRGFAADQAVMPGVGTHYALTKELGLLAGVHRGFSPPPPGDRVSSPESSVNWEAGARYQTRRFRAELIGFYNDYSNFTGVCSSEGGCLSPRPDTTFSAGGADIYGLEALAEADVKFNSKIYFPLRAAYTFTYTEFNQTFLSSDPVFGRVHAGDEIPYVPPHVLSLGAGIESPSWALNLTGVFVDRMWEHAGHGEPQKGDVTDAYFVLDASASYAVTKWLRPYVNVRNLLGEEYIASRRPYGARPGAPRWAELGAKLEF